MSEDAENAPDEERHDGEQRRTSERLDDIKTAVEILKGILTALQTVVRLLGV